MSPVQYAALTESAVVYMMIVPYRRGEWDQISSRRCIWMG